MKTPDNVLDDMIALEMPMYKISSEYCSNCDRVKNTRYESFIQAGGDDICNFCGKVFHGYYRYNGTKVKYRGFGTSYKFNCSANLYETVGHWVNH